MTSSENPFAGQGPVLLDIGGDVGALVVTMPAELAGIEVEIRPAGLPRSTAEHLGHAHPHDQGADSHEAHSHEAHSHQAHSHEAHSHDQPDGGHLPHVAVVPRPVAGWKVHSLVFPELVQGSYELYERPSGPVELTVTITGGQVTESVWPSAALRRSETK
jgi:hypothetical protein